MVDGPELLLVFIVITLFCMAIGVTADAAMAEWEEKRKR
jgi:hypothetical protein